MPEAKFRVLDGGSQSDVGGRINDLEDAIADLRSDVRGKGKGKGGGSSLEIKDVLLGAAVVAAAPVVVASFRTLFGGAGAAPAAGPAAAGAAPAGAAPAGAAPAAGGGITVANLISPLAGILAAGVVATNVGDEKVSDAALLTGLGFALSRLP